MTLLTSVFARCQVYVRAAAGANNIWPQIDVSDYFVNAENVRHFWIVLVMVCTSGSEAKKSWP